MSFRLGALICLMMVFADSANAQWANVPYLERGLGALNPQISSVDVRCVCNFGGGTVSLLNFANQGDVTNQFNMVSSQIAGINTNTSAMGVSINNLTAHLDALSASVAQLNVHTSQALQGAALGIAMRDAIPNEGDRFAIRVNLGAYSDQVAGSIGLTARVRDNVLLMVSYGQSNTLSAVSGGLNFSFQ